MDKQLIAQGAEGKIWKEQEVIRKERVKKSYRLPELDNKIRKLRTRAEGKILTKAQEIINVPKVIKTDEKTSELTIEYIKGDKLAETLDTYSPKEQERLCEEIGRQAAQLHEAGIIHGDLTTSNMIRQKDKIFFIDFGLAFQNGKYEDKAVDLHLLKEALEAKHFENWQENFAAVEKGYRAINKKEAQKVLERLIAVEKRGRYRH